MAKKVANQDNSKKAQGNARKAEAANKKKEAEDAKVAATEDEEWSKGGKKTNKKKEDEEAKKAEAARKKAERDAMLQEEEASLPSKPSKKGRGAEKIAAKKTGKIDDFLSFNEAPEMSASGLDAALEALTLTSKHGAVQDKDIERHPERRVKAAYAAFEEKRLPEVRTENPGLRLQQMKHLIFKEFEKSPENPMNQQTNIRYNASRDEVSDLKKDVGKKRETKFSR